jgi:hypothetical protein
MRSRRWRSILQYFGFLSRILVERRNVWEEHTVYIFRLENGSAFLWNAVTLLSLTSHNPEVYIMNFTSAFVLQHILMPPWYVKCMASIGFLVWVEFLSLLLFPEYLWAPASCSMVLAGRKEEVKVTLRPTISRSVHHGVEAHLGLMIGY